MSPLAGKPAATDPPNCTPVSRPALAGLRRARGDGLTSNLTPEFWLLP